MAEDRSRNRVLLDLNNAVFQENWLGLDKVERNRVTDTLRKLNQQTWEQVHRDAGLKWEKIVSVKPPHGIDALYSLRIAQSRRAIAYRQGDFMRFLSIASDHDAAYGKKYPAPFGGFIPGRVLLRSADLRRQGPRLHAPAFHPDPGGPRHRVAERPRGSCASPREAAPGRVTIGSVNARRPGQWQS